MLSNKKEGALVAYTDTRGDTHSAFFPRLLLEKELGAQATTPEIDNWFRQNSAEVSAAVLACNSGKSLAEPFKAIRSQGRLTVRVPNEENNNAN